MKLINNWKQAWRFLSVQFNALGTTIAVTYASMYSQLKDAFPPEYMAGVTAAVFILGIIGRVKSQGIEK